MIDPSVGTGTPPMSTHNCRLTRLVLGGLVPLTVICMAVIPPLLVWGRLPDPLASHFGLSGTPNGFMGRSTAFAGTWALAVLPSVWVTVSVLRSKRPSRAGGLVALGVLIGAVGVAASIARRAREVGPGSNSVSCSLVAAQAGEGGQDGRAHR